ncbi:MAG: DMT family transporter [Bdellovibrionales bacterium]|nr:DMT family transporter [Bdellovibrionales bacterium]
MSVLHQSLLLALLANLCFSSASLVFATFSRRVSPYWMNGFKAALAFCALLISVPFLSGFHETQWSSFAAFFASGLMGLNVGDLFLLSAFARIGAARTLILFGFQPLALGLASLIVFAQPLGSMRLLAIVFLIGCLFLFSWEGKRRHGHWELKGLLFALCGVGMDTFGILLTRWGFDQSPMVTPMEGHLYRCLGAVVGFALMSRFWRLDLLGTFQRLEVRGRWLVVGASLGGTYLSLLLYLWALQIGHLASLSAIAITGPLFAALLESLVHRHKPSRQMWWALLLFVCGFYLLLQ